MALIAKSNKAYAGPGTLTPVSVITRTAAQLYTAYAARVVADGGTVNNAAECQAAIQSALDGDYWTRAAVMASPNWGRKIVGANVAKLYNVRSTTVDGIAANTVALDTTSAPGENLAELQVGADAISFTGVTVLATGADALAVLAVVQGAAGSLLRTTFTPAAEAWLFNHGVSNLSMTVNAVSKFASNPEYAGSSLEAQLTMAEMSTLRTFGVTDGAVMKIMTPAGGFTPIVAGATATVTLNQNGGTPRLAEYWLFNNAGGMPGLNAMIRASTDAGARF